MRNGHFETIKSRYKHLTEKISYFEKAIKLQLQQQSQRNQRRQQVPKQKAPKGVKKKQKIAPVP